MKLTFLLTMALLINLFGVAQNIGIGTETPQGKLHIKGSADTSQLIIDANATQSGNHPLIVLRQSSGSELLRIHADNTTDLFIGNHAGQMNQGESGFTYNTFIGNFAGSLNTRGINNTAVGSYGLAQNTSGENNVAIGFLSLFDNINGSENTAVGTRALNFNTVGAQNTALGYNSLNSNRTGGNNTAIGTSALADNLSNFNTAVGAMALETNKSGTFNTAVGTYALNKNSGAAASYNTAIGLSALFSTTNSQYNSALGENAGALYDNGYNNVFVGANSDVNGAGYFNVIAIGQGTVCTASSQVTIGNSASRSYRAYANWSNISDGRFKKNIQENVPGLAFITQLRPVTYNLNATGLDDFLHSNQNDVAAMTGNSERTAAPVASETAKAAITKALIEKEQVTQTGFVAQEVAATAKKMGFNFSGIDAPANDKDVYGLRYAEFVVPLVKAVQELNANNTKQQQELESMKITIANLQQQMADLKALIKK